MSTVNLYNFFSILRRLRNVMRNKNKTCNSQPDENSLESNNRFLVLVTFNSLLSRILLYFLVYTVRSKYCIMLRKLENDAFQISKNVL